MGNMRLGLTELNLYIIAEGVGSIIDKTRKPEHSYKVRGIWLFTTFTPVVYTRDIFRSSILSAVMGIIR